MIITLFHNAVNTLKNFSSEFDIILALFFIPKSFFFEKATEHNSAFLLASLAPISARDNAVRSSLRAGENGRQIREKVHRRSQSPRQSHRRLRSAENCTYLKAVSAVPMTAQPDFVPNTINSPADKNHTRGSFYIQTGLIRF